MEANDRKNRLEEAINYLISKGRVDGTAPVKSMAQQMDRNFSNVSAACNGDVRYLTQKFLKTFAASYDNVINWKWIWDGSGVMVLDTETIPTSKFSEESLNRLSKDELVTLVKQLMALHSEQTELYRMLIRQNEAMIRNGQERFNNLTNIIFRNV